jgi:3-deoxy-D-manno-oct-2-ulosonic acid (Kdo) hydroxylase
MSDIVELPVTTWRPTGGPSQQKTAVQALERGHVLLFPQLDFAIGADERRAMLASVKESNKNVSFDPAKDQLRGSTAAPADQQVLADMLRRYGNSTVTLLDGLFPGYAAGRKQGRTSFRPVEIEGRKTSWRKDDTRLHVDSFPATPTQGRRILRVFTNINPNGQGRHWRLGEPFEAVAARFMPQLAPPLPGSAAVLNKLGITKTRRSAYDHYMLRLHDGMKADARYQAEVRQLAHEFPPACTWMVYTDQASHAAMRGQFALEQTWYLDVAAMDDPSLSPLHVLRRMVGRELV